MQKHAFIFDEIKRSAKEIHSMFDQKEGNASCPPQIVKGKVLEKTKGQFPDTTMDDINEVLIKNEQFVLVEAEGIVVFKDDFLKL